MKLIRIPKTFFSSIATKKNSNDDVWTSYDSKNFALEGIIFPLIEEQTMQFRIWKINIIEIVDGMMISSKGTIKMN